MTKEQLRNYRNIKLEHEPPWTCKLRQFLFGASPSAIMCRCLLGRMHGSNACTGCTANVREIIEVHWSRPGPCPITPEQFDAIYNEEEDNDK